MQFTLTELADKWGSSLNEVKDERGDVVFERINDTYKRKVVAQLLENVIPEGSSTADLLEKKSELINEATPTNVSGNAENYDPILIKLIRRMAPKLTAYDVMGVQPLSGPNGLIFALRSRYGSATGDEAFVDESNTAYGGEGTHASSDPFDPAFSTGTGMPTATAEGDTWNEMSITIEKTNVGVESYQLKATYSEELAHDLKAVHGIDAESELTNILSTELVSEINRRVMRTIYTAAKPGAIWNGQSGVFNLQTDADGRNLEEKIKGLIFAIDRDANRISKETRRGRGNILICSADVASALSIGNALQYNMTSAATDDPVGVSYIGDLKGKFKVYVDPYVTSDFYVVGYKGSSPYDAGIFYCPYYMLQKVKAVDPDSFQPAIGFKSRAGIVANPFTSLAASENAYYRKVKVENLL